MLLRTVDVGHGDKTALLLHGLMGSAESWWRVIPLLVEHGYRVLAMDLPGHGLSPRDPDLTMAKAAASVTATLEARAPQRPLHAIGHSYGATVLAAAGLDAEVTVYVDSALSFTGGDDRTRLIERYESDRRNRQDPAWLRSSRPFYTAKDAEVEARAATCFDPATSASISCGDDVVLMPREGAILVHAEPSNWVTDDDKHRFAEQGVSVRGIRSAAHTVWYSHFDEFTASVPEVFGEYP
ncbi:pimeloyl-ACP methyl ester carboxylesterase [Microbacterium natoriense]|uniref:Pimeloyl-ACP methyl ester carboxylesterase n=1 Tax=Microbacterium natoriense TaxID=284570 RepID=A0AAW8EZU1_9MICO|nr:alpha/beta hydrolase family protein [Microbacterium natoriense]MDQ0649031.1 pimeloyl-ACP methyl ester carboxylesterase [Microbacterium natoriense]